MRLEGGRSGPPTVGGRVGQLDVVMGGQGGMREGILRMSMSAGVTYCVPATHWKFEIVGLGGMRASGLNSLSNDFGLQGID